ncbi:MAG: hypothetical protein A2Z88_00520 [Omnitrophica WOR_2 bacterium GWA2_47_8]|nr:MAG: hypothetical protein A2Z88_00520 [Omnitrophica WOR_2 bacterium GWA2_47_8]
MKDTSGFPYHLGLLWLRVLMGAGIAYHGYGKVFGGDLSMLTQGLVKMGFPFPEIFAWAAALSEFLGGICIALGLFTRPAAFFLFITMSVAAFVVHSKDPFTTKELALAYGTMAGMLILTGGGDLTVERMIKGRK